jgi:glucose 1-dehydrogenase
MATQTAISTVGRYSLESKVAIITGGDQGIGRAIALRLAAEGADIAFCYRTNRSAAEEVVASITRVGAGAGIERRALALQADVSDTAQVQNFITTVFERFGRTDILVNNAGLERRADFWDVTEKDYDLVLNVNLKGVFFTTQAVVRLWLADKQHGKIVNISSVHEELPFPHFASYCVSKGGLKMLARDLAIELAPYGITINNIAPGAIETPINKALLNDPAKLKALLENIPLKRLGRADDVAGVVAFLASADADYITGTTVFVDGGLLWSYEEQ